MRNVFKQGDFSFLKYKFLVGFILFLLLNKTGVINALQLAFPITEEQGAYSRRTRR